MEVRTLPTLCRGGRLCPPAAPKVRYGCGTPLAGAVCPTTPQSISTTSPVCPMRICIAFLAGSNMLCSNQPPGMVQEGGISPLLGRVKGDRKGGAPARIQRSDSRGKRRNNETDETCRLRRTGLVRSVVPPFPTRIASLDSRGSLAPFANPLKRPRRGVRPPSWSIPGGWFVQSISQTSKNAMQMRIG